MVSEAHSKRIYTLELSLMDFSYHKNTKEYGRKKCIIHMKKWGISIEKERL